MARLEFKKFSTEEIKEVFKALLNNSEYVVEYNNKDNEKKTYALVKGGRLYLDNNYSINLSKNEEKDEVYLSVDYFTSDDRVRLFKNKQEKEFKEVKKLDL